MTAHRKWLLGGIAAAVLIFLLGFLLLVNPARTQASDIQSQADNVNENNTTLASKLELLKQQSAEVPARLEEIEAVKQKMPTEMKQADLVRSIEQQAQSAGVDLITIAPATPSTLEGSTTNTVVLPITITADGRYANVKTFVDNMERLERAFLIRSVDVTTSDAAADSFTLSLDGDFFSLPEGTLETPDPAATVPVPAPAASAAAKAPPKQHKASKPAKDKAHQGKDRK